MASRIALVALVLVSACGVEHVASDAFVADDAGPDAFVVPIDAFVVPVDAFVPRDAPRPDTSVPPDAASAGLPSATNGTTGAPSALSCVGTSTMPTAGAASTRTLDLVAFGQAGDRAPNLGMCFCATGVLSPESLLGTYGGTCGTCQHLTTDAMGQASVTAMAGGWYAYRVFGHMGATLGTSFVDTIEIDAVPTTAPTTLPANAVSRLTENLIAAAELLELAPATAMVVGRVVDCGRAPIAGAIIRVFHVDGTEILSTGAVDGPSYSYFDGAENPDASAVDTATDGLYAALNLPHTAAELLRVEAWAYSGPAASGAPHRIGCEAIPVLADGVDVLVLGPTRADYPAGHPCH